MKSFKGISKILLAIALVFGVFGLVSPVYAENGNGEEWSGEIVDPIPEPPTPEPTPAPTPAPTPTPAPAPTPAKPTPAKTTTPVVAPVVEEPEAEPEVEVVPEVVEETLEVEEETPEVEEVVEETPEETEEVMVPETANPTVVRKATLIAIICTGIAVFSTIFVWGVMRLSRILHFERIYKEAIAKSAKIKEAGITRAG